MMDESVRAQIDQLVQWTDSRDALAAARGLLHRVGLPIDDDHVDDVLAEVTFRITRRLDRLGPLEARPGVIAYARTTMGTVVSDLLRGRRLDLAFDDDAPVPDTLVVETTFEVDDIAGTVDELRRVLHLRVGPVPAWAVSAALTVTTISIEPDLLVQGGTPVPTDRGSDQRAKWVGLHYAGRRDCFTDQDGAPDTACRNRRARAIRTLDLTLAAAFAAMVETGATADHDAKAHRHD